MQKISLKSIAAGSIAAVATVSAPLAALAASSLENLNASAAATAGAAGVTSGETNLPKLIGNFIGAALGLLGVILVCIIIYAGFLWMTAQGNDEKVKQAKKMISNAVVGMVLIFAAYAITNFVIASLTNSLKG
jgi:hypothetical protein